MRGLAFPKKPGVIVCASLIVVALSTLAACAQQQASSPAKEDLSSASDVPMLVVPNVVSLTLSDAERSIVSSGLKLGDVNYEASDTVPTGNVISQSPEALSTDIKDRTVSVVVSSGKASPKMVAVPDVKGLNQAKAEKKLADVGLIGIYAGSEETTDVAPGKAFKQSVEPGTEVAEGSKVTFTIAIAPSKVTVPNVLGMKEDKAESALEAAKLSFDTTSVHSEAVDAGLVISQSYGAGSEVQVGTTVTITLSLGPKPAEKVTVPNVITYSWSEAEATMESAGLVARHTGDPSGVVIDQDFDAGTKVDEGTIVTLTLSTPDDSIEVPNLAGMSVAAAENLTDKLGLSLDGGNSGIIVSQKPDAGVKVEPDTVVTVKTQDADVDVEQKTSSKVSASSSSNGDVNGGSAAGAGAAANGDDDDDDKVEVPDLIGLDVDDATDSVEEVGLNLDSEGEGSVVEQTPEAGTMVDPGSIVSVKLK